MEGRKGGIRSAAAAAKTHGLAGACSHYPLVTLLRGEFEFKAQKLGEVVEENLLLHEIAFILLEIPLLTPQRPGQAFLCRNFVLVQLLPRLEARAEEDGAALALLAPFFVLHLLMWLSG